MHIALHTAKFQFHSTIGDPLPPMVERSVKSGVKGAQPVVEFAEKLAVGLPNTVITLVWVSVSVPAAFVTVRVTVNVPELG